MPVVVKLDLIKTLSASERFGVVIRMVRLASVTGLGDELDFQVLQKALDAVGVPKFGSNLFNEGFTALVLAERNVTVVDKNLTEIELIYEQIPIDGQIVKPFDFSEGNFLGTTDNVFVGKITSSINQVETNKDIDGKAITVEYKYPADDADFPNQTRQQGGEIGVFKPQKTWTGRMLRSTIFPKGITNGILLKVNEFSFLGENSKLWLCTAANYTPYDIFSGGVISSKATYLMDFEFQFDPDGWDPGIVFRHEITGVIPGDLIKDVGFKNVPSYEVADFTEVLGVGSVE